MAQCDFFMVAYDASNHNETKLLPVLIRYCLLDSKAREICIKTAILDIHSLQDEKAKTVTDVAQKSIKKFPIHEKIIGFLADNAPANFGALNSDTQGNVHAMLQKELGRTIIPIGCAGHINHNALGSAVHSVLPIDIENIIIKIFYHFKYQTVQHHKLEEYCEFVGCEMKKILKHTETRWLSLFPCVQRLLENYEAFKSYFISETNIPAFLYNVSNDEKSEFWLLFVHAQLQLFTETLEEVQAQDLAAIEVTQKYLLLLQKVKNRYDISFPFTASNYLKKIDTLTERQVEAVAQNFYHKIVMYMENWEKRLFHNNDFKVFTLNAELNHDEFAVACQSILKTPVSDNELFDACSFINSFLEEHLKEENWSDKRLLRKWSIIYSDFVTASIDFGFLNQIVQFMFIFSGINAECERIFSLINCYWSDEKSQLAVSTLESVMKIKSINLGYEEFFELIKNDTKLIEKFLSSDKYNDVVALGLKKMIKDTYLCVFHVM